MNMHEYFLNITGQRLSQWDVTVWPPHLHQHPETRVIDNLERPVTLCDPMDKSYTEETFVRCICNKPYAQTYRDSNFVN